MDELNNCDSQLEKKSNLGSGAVYDSQLYLTAYL